MRPQQVIDISLKLPEGSPVWPGDPGFSRVVVSESGGGRSEVARLELSSHVGTHLDTPSHFLPEGRRVGDYPPERFVLPARVADIPGAAVVSAGDLEHVELAEGQALVLKTDNSATGRCRSGRFEEGFVAIDESAAEWLADRRVPLVGIDYLSIEPYRQGPHPHRVHVTLLEADVLILEGLDLTDVPAGEYLLSCPPLRIPAAEATPVRAMLLRR
jgi:arylformamidase